MIGILSNSLNWFSEDFSSNVIPNTIDMYDCKKLPPTFGSMTVVDAFNSFVKLTQKIGKLPIETYSSPAFFVDKCSIQIAGAVSLKVS